MCPQVKCILETILKPFNTPHHLEASKFLCSLLPYEVYSSPVSQLFMEDKGIKMEVGPKKELNVSNTLSPSHQKIVLQLLWDNQTPFSWDYMDMKG